MVVFFETYKLQFLYIAIILATVVTLFFITGRIHKWLTKRKLLKHPYESNTALNLIKRILNALWFVLGVIAISLLFVDQAGYVILMRDLKLFIYLGFIGIVTTVSATTINLWFKKRIEQKIKNGDDTTTYKFLRYVAVSMIAFTGLVLGLLIFPSLRSLAQTALGGAGVLAIIIGVASQEALANLVGGLFIIAFKPFKIGDTIRLTDTMVGQVRDVTLRHTVIRNYENKMIIIPNAVINKEKLINYDIGELKCCERIEIGISYDSDVSLAKKIMQEECENNPLIYDNRNPLEKKSGKPIVKTALTALNDSSVTIRAWAWAKNYEDSFELRCNVLESIKKRFENEGIEIPYPSQTIIMRTNEIKKEKDVNAI